MKKLILIALSVFAFSVSHAETIPPKPDKYFNDYANLVTPEDAHNFNEQLAQFERDTSNQFLVVVYPTLDSESPPADYCQKLFHEWQIGQGGDKRNGIILFVFMKTN